MNPDSPSKQFLTRQNLIFFLVLFGLIGFAILRSSLATSNDSFTYDEAYHIGTGVAHVRTRDFRLNPEQPPLVKVWVGAFVSRLGFQLSPYRVLEDKHNEREFVETDVYINNDADVIQRRSRAAMLVLNSLLLFAFALAARCVFVTTMALGATAYLVIDPTVAAHFPVVMTDLPVALLSTTAVLLAIAAFRTWRVVDLILAALVLGLALSAKHSAVITMIAVLLIGILMAILSTKGVNALLRLRRVGAVVAVLVGAVIVLWAFYLFRFRESPTTYEEQFNRPLAVKISDVASPVYRSGLSLMARGRLLPRAYTWGMADTIRAGAEGRAISILAFGNLYYSKAPVYYFPGILAVKIPLGLLLLTAIGACLIIMRRIPSEAVAPLIAVIGLALLFLLALVKGSSYAGIRHALPAVPPLALIGSVAISGAVKSRSYLLRGAVIVALAGALLSAIPVRRPWEYFNETVGRAANGYHYFNDEGLDLSLRTKEIVDYYNQNLKPNGEIPFVVYFSSRIELRRRGLDWVGREPERDGPRISADTLSGTFIIGAKELAPALWWDVGNDLRQATPVARFGNVLVFRGSFLAPPAAKAFRLYMGAVHGKIYSAQPDIEGAIKMLTDAVALDSKAFFVALELGNQYLKIGNREEALRAYGIAKENSPASDAISELLARQIERVKNEPLEYIQPLRNPALE